MKTKYQMFALGINGWIIILG